MPTNGQPITEIDRFLAFITERHEITRRKRRGLPKPWTTWWEFLDYKFCCVYRELDRVSEWIADEWRDPNADDPDCWFAMAVSRWLNWPPTLEELQFPVPWNRDHFVEVLRAREERGDQIYGPAYTINAGRGGSKILHVAEDVLDPLWANRDTLRPRVGDTLSSFTKRLMEMPCMGGFMSGQVCADVKFVAPLDKASDWWRWCISGPGSRRGLNRLLGRDKNAAWSEMSWLFELQKLHREISPMIRAAKLPPLCAQNLQNNCCEWDKIERLRNGEGTPKQRYPGRPEGDEPPKRQRRTKLATQQGSAL